MGKKSLTAFLKHVCAIKEKMDAYNVIITGYEMDYLYRIYENNKLSEFKERVREFIKRKKEEN